MVHGLITFLQGNILILALASRGLNMKIESEQQVLPRKPIKQMDEDELIWCKTLLMQQRRKMDERISKINWALAMRRAEKEERHAGCNDFK